MSYSLSHYEKVAALYKKYGSVERVQDHFPASSVRSVQRWVKKCRETGLL